MKPLDSQNVSSPSEVFKHGFVHSVYFWLKPGLSAEEISEFETGVKKLVEESDFASTGHVGKPAGTDREIVDNSYDYSLIVTFDDAEGHQAYQDEEPHDRFREIAGKYAERVLIFDSKTA